MTESAPAADGVALNDPFAVLTGPLAATTRMQLEVVDSHPLGPGMQRLVLPAFFAMAGALPAGARALVILEVPGPGGEQELVTAADAAVTWLHRDGGAAGDPAALVAAAAAVALPPGRGHAYLAGEATVVLRLREALAARGLAPEQISPKAYWGRGRANAEHGEPAKDV